MARTPSGLYVPDTLTPRTREVFTRDDLQRLRRAMQIAEAHGLLLALVCQACSTAERSALLEPLEDPDTGREAFQCACRYFQVQSYGH